MNLHYVSGFFDADGYVTLIKISSKRETAKAPIIGFTNTQVCILHKIQSLLLEQGIKGRISKKTPAKENHSVGYDLKYERNHALRLAELLQAISTHPKKVHRLNMLLCCYRGVVPRNGKYTEQMLKDLQLFEEQFFQQAA